MSLSLNSFIIILCVLGVCFVLFLLPRISRALLAVLLLAVFLPILASFMLGNGQYYVNAFASFFTPPVKQEIIDGYQYYQEQYKEHPLIDLDRLNQFALDIDSLTKSFLVSETGKNRYPLFPWLSGLNRIEFFEMLQSSVPGEHQDTGNSLYVTEGRTHRHLCQKQRPDVPAHG